VLVVLFTDAVECDVGFAADTAVGLVDVAWVADCVAGCACMGSMATASIKVKIKLGIFMPLSVKRADEICAIVPWLGRRNARRKSGCAVIVSILFDQTRSAIRDCGDGRLRRQVKQH
jgi:hypothetical protein